MLEDNPEGSMGACSYFIFCWSFSKRRSEQERILSGSSSSHHQDRGAPGLQNMLETGWYHRNGSYNPHRSYSRHIGELRFW